MLERSGHRMIRGVLPHSRRQCSFQLRVLLHRIAHLRCKEAATFSQKYGASGPRLTSAEALRLAQRRTWCAFPRKAMTSVCACSMVGPSHRSILSFTTLWMPARAAQTSQASQQSHPWHAQGFDGATPRLHPLSGSFLRAPCCR